MCKKRKISIAKTILMAGLISGVASSAFGAVGLEELTPGIGTLKTWIKDNGLPLVLGSGLLVSTVAAVFFDGNKKLIRFIIALCLVTLCGYFIEQGGINIFNIGR